MPLCSLYSLRCSTSKVVVSVAGLHCSLERGLRSRPISSSGKFLRLTDKILSRDLTWQGGRFRRWIRKRFGLWSLPIGSRRKLCGTRLTLLLALLRRPHQINGSADSNRDCQSKPTQDRWILPERARRRFRNRRRGNLREEGVCGLRGCLTVKGSGRFENRRLNGKRGAFERTRRFSWGLCKRRRRRGFLAACGLIQPALRLLFLRQHRRKGRPAPRGTRLGLATFSEEVGPTHLLRGN